MADKRTTYSEDKDFDETLEYTPLEASKCLNTLIEFTRRRSNGPAVIKLVQSLISGSVTPDQFVTKWPSTVLAPPIPNLQTFMELSLPGLREGLEDGRFTIYCIKPPSQSVAIEEIIPAAPQSQVSESTEMLIADGVQIGRSMKAHESFFVRLGILPMLLECLPAHAIRSTDSKTLYFVQNSKKPPAKIYAETDPRHLELYRVIRTSNYTWALERSLDFTYNSFQSSLGPVIDEIAGKLYIGLGNTSQRVTIQQYDFKFGPQDKFGNKSLKVEPDKRGCFTVNLTETIFLTQLFVWPPDGTLLVYGVSLHEAEQTQRAVKVGWLERKKRSYRTLFAHFLEEHISFPSTEFEESCIMQPTCISVVYDRKSLHVVCAKTSETPSMVKVPMRDTPQKWHALTVTKSNRFETEVPFEIPTAKFIQKFIHPEKDISYMKLLGKLYHSWLVAFSWDNDTDDHTRPWLLAFRDNASFLCKLKLKKAEKYSPIFTTFHLLSSTIIATELSVADYVWIRKINLTDFKYARQVKMYRFCAHCGKQERKKRKNNGGERVADFKICRECKNLGLHRSWQVHPCHYCSWECIKADWPKHKLLH